MLQNVQESVQILANFLKFCQWRNKVAVGPRAIFPKGPPLPPKNFKKTASGKFWALHSVGPACTARLARPIVTPLNFAALISFDFIYMCGRL